MSFSIKKSARKKKLWAALTVMLAIIVISKTFTTVSAQTADNILRPLLGSQRTLELESVYFGIQDKLNQLHYDLFGQHTPTYAYTPPVKTVSVKTIKAQPLNGLNLAPFSNEAVLPKLTGEGEWVPMASNLFSQNTVMARSFIRPDASRPYAVVSLVKMDMSRLGLGVQAGTYYPGGTHGVYGPGIVPRQIQASNSLVAAFNGGFQEQDGHYGMVVNNITYVPLKSGLPAILIDQAGKASFFNYTGQPIPADTTAIRQNGPYLINNGQLATFGGQGTSVWGRTITNSMYTWRSGIGITKRGNLIYAVGNSLVPQTLASALLKAGAVEAIQLDINPPWVRFISYQSRGDGLYSNTPLLGDMVGGEAYLRSYNKDFFYVYMK